jgi:hypothetical protein
MEVLSLAGNDKSNVDTAEENAEHDETPIVIVVPGLTSDSKDSVSY